MVQSFQIDNRSYRSVFLRDSEELRHKLIVRLICRHYFGNRMFALYCDNF